VPHGTILMRLRSHTRSWVAAQDQASGARKDRYARFVVRSLRGSEDTTDRALMTLTSLLEQSPFYDMSLLRAGVCNALLDLLVDNRADCDHVFLNLEGIFWTRGVLVDDLIRHGGIPTLVQQARLFGNRRSFRRMLEQGISAAPRAWRDAGITSLTDLPAQ
jgi:hypothetical protein